MKAALETTLEAIQKRADGEHICTYGPLIHNRQVLALLEERGIKEENSIDRCAGKKVVIRAHGIPPQERNKLHELGADLLDATCKRVAKVHAAIKRHARKGYHTVIAGDADHAEVIGLMGYSEGRGVVVNRPEQVAELPADWKDVLLVAQTTQNEEIFQEIQKVFLERYPEGKVKNTICDSTHERQAEVRKLCSQVEAMVIVGGFHSGNTIRLAEVARECSVPTYHVETETELDREEMSRYSCIGVSAGASTPNWIIRNVVRFLEGIHRDGDSAGNGDVKRKLKLAAFANIYIALGGALLPFAVQALTGAAFSFSWSILAAMYVFAMHSLNIYLDKNAAGLNDPDRADFYLKYRMHFMASSVAAMAIAVLISVNYGVPTFLALSLLILLGVLYAVPFLLPAWTERFPISKLKDIPTSKTLFVPIAWAAVTVVLPHISSSSGTGFFRLTYSLWTVFLMVLIRTNLLDLLAVQGDRLAGKETLVVLVGENTTVHYTAGFLALLALTLILGPVLGLSSRFSWLLLPAVAAYIRHLHMCSKNKLIENPIHEALIESVIIGAGLAGLVWRLIVL